MSKKQLSEDRLCKCGYYGKDFAQTSSECRPCKSISNKKINDKHNKINQSPENRTSTYRRYFDVPDKLIYGIVDENKNVVYIGESKRGSYRLYRHFNAGEGNTTLHKYRNENWSYIILWDGTDFSKQDRLMLEAVLIQSLRPKYNKQWQQED